MASALLSLDILLPDLPTLWITPYLYLHIARYLVRCVCYFGVGSPSGFERYKAVSLTRLRAPVLCVEALHVLPSYYKSARKMEQQLLLSLPASFGICVDC